VSTEAWSRLSTDAFTVALFAYIAGMIGYFYHLAFRRTAVWRVAWVAAGVGLAAHVVSVAGGGGGRG
jgi:hypothetical protein